MGVSEAHPAEALFDVESCLDCRDSWVRKCKRTSNGSMGSNVPYEQVKHSSHCSHRHILDRCIQSGISFSRLIGPVLTYYIQSFTADKARAERWRGLRQDSGDPFEFIAKARATYEKMGVDYRKKVIVFSDGLDVELSIKIQKVIDEEGFIGALVSRIRKGANACVQVRMVLEHFSQMTTRGRTMVRGVNH